MAKQKAQPEKIEGARYLATIKPGWRTLMNKQGRLYLVHPDQGTRIIELTSIEEGDVLPRDTDAAIDFSPGVGGH